MTKRHTIHGWNNATGLFNDHMIEETSLGLKQHRHAKPPKPIMQVSEVTAPNDHYGYHTLTMWTSFRRYTQYWLYSTPRDNY